MSKELLQFQKEWAEQFRTDIFEDVSEYESIDQFVEVLKECWLPIWIEEADDEYLESIYTYFQNKLNLIA